MTPSTADDAPLLLDVTDAVATLRLNRPKFHNALDRDLIDALTLTLTEMDARPDVHVIVLVGNGESFCAGGDIVEFAQLSGAPLQTLQVAADRAMQMYGTFARLRKPVVVGVRGHALAGGCGLALCGDFIIAGQSAQFGFPETLRGFVPALVSVLLARLVKPLVALDLLLTGRTVKADEALSLGLVSRVVADDDVDEEALATARSLAQLDPTAVQMTRELFFRVNDLPLAEAFNVARDANVLMRYSDGFARGAAEFVEGRADL
jgi:enoyl-CoA hydratase/carnithine racemase